MASSQRGSLIVIHALTFLHPGTGQTTGVIDLPVQREVHTGLPMMASSGLKGSFRDKAEREWGKASDDVKEVFGSEDAQMASALAVTDGRILALPVRSLQNVFVWVTAPMVVKRLARDAALAGIALSVPTDLRVDVGNALASRGSGFRSPLMLEELALEVASELSPALGLDGLLPDDIRAEMQERLVVVSDDDFQYLARHATQIAARIKLNDETKTTSGEGGNLWYEETLPPETVMYALAFANAPRNGSAAGDGATTVMRKTQALLSDGYIQIGGNETVGQGWCRLKFVGGVA